MPEWLYADMGIAVRRRRLQRHLSDRFGRRRSSISSTTAAPRFLFVEDEEQLDKFLEVRDALPDARKIFVFDMEGLRDFSDPMVMSLDELHGARPRLRRGGREALWEELIASSQRRGPRDPGLHLGHHRPAQGRDAFATATSLFQLRHADAFIPLGEDDEQLAFLPLCHVAERTFSGFYMLAALGRRR